MKSALILLLGVACLCSAQLTTYCTDDEQCNVWSDYNLKYCNTTATPGVCASLMPVTEPGASVGPEQYCQGLWKVTFQHGSYCMRGIRPGGKYVGDSSTDFCIHSSYNTADRICRQREINQADCSGSNHNCKLGYECIHTKAGHVCQNAGNIGSLCGGYDFGHSGCTDGVCVGHTCKPYVGKGDRCQEPTGALEDARCPEYMACNLGKCVNAFSVPDNGDCTTGTACKSAVCYLGHCLTRKRNVCSNNAECDTAFCKLGKCWLPFEPFKDSIDCLKSNKMNGQNVDDLMAACPKEFAKSICASACTFREDERLDAIPEILALSSVDCATGVITADSTAVANPGNIIKNCDAVANYGDY